MKHWSEQLPWKTCGRALRWAKTQPSLKEAWKNCERGDWMLWQLCQKMKQNSELHRRIVSVACKCARFALPYVSKDEESPLQAITLAEKWAAGENINRRELFAAAHAVSCTRAYAVLGVPAAASVAAYSAASAVVYTAAYSAAHSGTAYSVVDAASSAASYAAEAVSYATRTTYAKTLKACANIVRAEFPEPPELQGKKY